MNSKFYLALLFFKVILVFPFPHQVTIDEVARIAIQRNYDIRVAPTTVAKQFIDKNCIYRAFLIALLAELSKKIYSEHTEES